MAYRASRPASPASPSRTLWTPSRGISFAPYSPPTPLAAVSMPQLKDPKQYISLKLVRSVHDEAVSHSHHPVADGPSVVDAKPDETEPDESKPVKAKPIKTKTAKTKTANAKTANAKPVETEPVRGRPAKTKSAETKPSKAKFTKTKSTETKSTETKSTDTKSTEPRPAKAKSAKTKPMETKAVETKSAKTKSKSTKTDSTEVKSTEAKSAETKATKTKSTKIDSAKAKPGETKPAEPAEPAETKDENSPSTAVGARTSRRAWAPSWTSNSAYKLPELRWEMAFGKPVTHPKNDLPWTIPQDVFAQAQSRTPGTEGSYYSHKLYRGPGRLGQNSPVTVHYCRSRQTTEAVCKTHFMKAKVFGFDLEWYPNATRYQGARENVSVMQIATPDRIGVFHIARFPLSSAPLIPPSLKKILEDPKIIKCGVWILGDYSRLKQYLSLKPRGAIDLSHLHNLVAFSRLGKSGTVPKRGVRMADQVEQALGLPLYKGTEVRTSMWQNELNLDQINYSASDAYAGLQLFTVYEHQRKKLHPIPPLPPLAELKQDMRRERDDGITAEEEDAFREAQGSVLDDAIISTKTTRMVAQRTEKEETKDALLTKTTIATATVTKTMLTTRTPKRSPPKPSNDNPPKPTNNRTPKSPKSSILHKPEVVAATSWAQEFTDRYGDRLDAIAKLSELRAYRLWATDPSLTVSDVAAMLRDPPLETTTVGKYIMSALLKHSQLRPDGGQGLPVDKDRILDVTTSLKTSPGLTIGSRRVKGSSQEDVGTPAPSDNDAATEPRAEMAAQGVDDLPALQPVDYNGGGGQYRDALPVSSYRSTSPTPSEEQLMIELDEQLQISSAYGEQQKMRIESKAYWDVEIVCGQEELCDDEALPGERSYSPTPSDMDALLSIARDEQYD